MRKKHILVNKYLKEHSLVESNIISFNDFIDKAMQQIVDEYNQAPSEEEREIKLGKIRVGRPNIIEADGSSKLIMPTEAMIRNLTYSAPVFLEISTKYEDQFESHEVEIGRIPIIVRSKICNTHGLSMKELESEYIDPIDPGGYFIINGNERVIVMTEDLAENQLFIEKNKGVLMVRLFSKRGAYRIPVYIFEDGEGIFNATFSKFKNVPAIPLIKALGMVKDADIAKAIHIETDSSIVNLYEFTGIQSSEDALKFLAERTNLQGTQKEILDRMKQRLDSYFMPHIGVKKEDRIEKAKTLCKFIRQLLIAKDNPSVITDKDHYGNKRVRLSGDLLADLFRVNLNIFIRDIQYSLKKISRRRKFYSIKTIAKSTLFTHRVESAIATGNWIGERKGVTQNIDRTNYLSMISQLQRVSSTLPGEQENFLARTLHPTHYGRFCPIETPEGVEIGLRKNLSILSKVSTSVNLTEDVLVNKFIELGLDRGSEYKGSDVFFNGKYTGFVNNGNEFVNSVRDIRRNGNLPIELSVYYDENLNTVFISTEVGRILRPLIIVKDGNPLIKDEHELLLQEGRISWNDLVKKGIVEYIDAAEEENSLVALDTNEITTEHTHLEVDKVAFLGLVASLVPFANYGQPSRLIKGSKTQKQSLGIYAANFPIRLNTDANILHYPQKPIVRSFIYDTLNLYPAGQNVVVAVMTYEGYNMEDAIVMNKGSVQRGLGRSTFYKPYTNVELHYAGGLADDITIPDKDASGYRTESSYKYLEDDGVVYLEANINDGDVLIGKIAPPKFLSESRDITIKNKKDASTILGQGDKGVVDTVFITSDSDGNKVVHVKTRHEKIPEPGDKFSNPYGQKGVIGYLLDENDVPFTSNGIKPDIIFNPHAIPSRMTVGYLLEILAGKSGCLGGKTIDATAFSNIDVKQLENVLKEYGFSYDGKENVYDPISGKKMNAKIFVGNMYYLKLKYMVSNKIHARASGKVTLLTRQPVEGRAKGGALRLGEMEQEALVAHGASLLLKERYDSDKIVVDICEDCGAIGIKDRIAGKKYCPVCGSNEIEEVEMSYAFKLLIEELQSLHIQTYFELKNKYE
ncbi:DNA-directed RNA polymerase subunit B'' [Candidatus Pacearchaeota archaeon]|nr:DNA-directed RNA polymerase subunit B'' [Candidatus Pacearchaeota archaeon]